LWYNGGVDITPYSLLLAEAEIAFIIIGLIILLIGLLKKSAALIIVGVAMFLSLLLYTLISNPNMSYALSAFSTIALALFAGVTIFLSYQARKDASDREKRDRREKLLNEIIEWAEDVAKAAISRQTRHPHELWKIKLEYKYQKSKGKYISVIVSSSFTELSNLLEEINKKLDETIICTQQAIDDTSVGEALKKFETELTNSVEKILEEAAKIKNKI
jgi:membrane protein implicated in regulation of membrane protease activity